MKQPSRRHPYPHLAVVVITSLVMAFVAAQPQTPAQAVTETPSGPYRLVAAHSALVVDNTNAGITQQQASGTASQTWTIASDGTGLQIRSASSGLCLTGSGSGAPVTTTTCAVTPAQHWTFTTQRAGYQISNASTGLALDISGGSGSTGAPVISWASSGADNQTFLLETPPGAAGFIAPGAYTFTAAHSTLAVDASGNSLTQQPVTADNSQVFTVSRVGAGSRLRAIESGLCVTDAASGAQITLTTCGQASSQQWAITAQGAGVRITNVASGRALDVASGSTAAGAQVISWPSTGAANQTFRLDNVGWYGTHGRAMSGTSTAFSNTTIRMPAHLSVGGQAVQVTLSNRFGNGPLTVSAATIARQSTGAGAASGSIAALTWGDANSTSVVIPAGATAVSNPLPYPVSADTNLQVSLHLTGTAVNSTSHQLGMEKAYLASGNTTQATDAAAFTSSTESTYFLQDVTVVNPKLNGTVVAVGDSITDGYDAGVSTNQRWPDLLARRILSNSATPDYGVINSGISGNRLLNEGTGPRLVNRYNVDALDRSGATIMIIMIGVNDIRGGNPTSDQLIAGLKQLVDRGHTAGMKVHLATITPFGNAGMTAQQRATWNAVNQWIRTPGTSDGYVDFAAAIADPNNPDVIAPTYDCGDGLHPNAAGFQQMANAIPLSWFTAN